MQPVPTALLDKVAVVTGASRGIGRAIARKLASLGAHVYLCARKSPDLDLALQELLASNLSAEAFPLNVTRAEEWDALASRIRDQHDSKLNILVNNAGVGVFGKPLQETSLEDWTRMVDTNLKGVYLGIKAATPLLMAASGGDIINISSIAGKNAVKNGAAYAATKWGVNGLSISAAEELREHNVRVSVVCPGSTVSNLNLGRRSADTSKMLQPEDIAHVVAMLVTQSPQSFISEVVVRPTQKP